MKGNWTSFWRRTCLRRSSIIGKSLVWGVGLSLLIQCSPYYPRCSEVESQVLNAAIFGDTVALAAYLDGAEEYDFACRRHDDFLRAGESLSGAVMESSYPAVLRTYLRYPISSVLKDELLWLRSGHDSGYVHTRIALDHGAHLTYPSKECIVRKMIECYEPFDSLGYDFNWVDPTTGNNMLMDYCACKPNHFREDFVDVMRFLLSKGVRMDIKNLQGETAIDIAERSGAIEVLREAQKE